ncbi:MAG: DUF551 domain-containing protein [Ruminococcus sp.]|nr:DUF551 domain-containing protein [Ruminococcus sp.]
MSEWISVKDRLPEDGEEVLIYSTTNEISMCYYDEDTHRFNVVDSDLYWNEISVTHWAPLPEPPKGE